MESPMKKLKISGHESPPLRVSSSQMSDAPEISSSSLSDSKSSISEFETSRDSATARKALEFRETRYEPKNHASFCDLLEYDEESHSTFSGSRLEDDASDDDDFNFEDYFNRSRSIQRRGIFWNLYKPLQEEDDNSLYFRIMNDPASAPDIAKWFVHYCSCRSVDSSTIILYRFFFDCAGYQIFDVKKYYGNLNALLSILNGREYTNVVFKSTRFLLEDSSKNARVLKNGIYYFLQQLVVQAQKKDVLYGGVLKKFTNLLIAMRTNKFRPLLYASYLFGMKLLTGICMVKEQVADMALEGFKSNTLDSYLNLLYVHFTKGCCIPDKNMAPLRIESLKELKQFIIAAPSVFIDGYNCLEILKNSVICDVASVRIESLDLIMKIVQNKSVVECLSPNSKEQLSNYVFGRVSDIKLEVVLKAIQVSSVLVKRLGTKNLGKQWLPKITKAIYYEDYRIASAAAKCVIDILKITDQDDKTLLRSLCTLAKTFHPNLKPLMVEAVAEHTSILRNWPLIMKILTMYEHFEDFPIELRVVLSELFLESLHLTITGKSTKQRSFSFPKEMVHLNNEENLAQEIYQHVKTIVKIYFKKSGEIISNVLKALSIIRPDYVGKTSRQIIADILAIFTDLFDNSTDPVTWEPLVSFLAYVNDNFPSLNEITEDVIKELENNVITDLYEAFETKSYLVIKKAAVVFSKFDLNRHVEWHKLATVWNMSPDPEFVDNILTCCHHALMWKLIKVDTRQGKADLDKDISTISSMSSQFLVVCYEVLRSQDNLVRFKGFERLCEFSISFAKHLQQISKQERALGNLKLTFNDNLENAILDLLKAAVDPNTEAKAYQFRKYINYIRQLAYAEILPVDFMSNIFIYYDQHYEHYGKLIDSILLKIREEDENWIAMLIVNAISILHKSVFDKNGSVDWRSSDGKAILSLSRRFIEFKKIMSPTISGKILYFAVNYVSENHLYDFLIYVRCFCQDTVDRGDIIKNIQQKIPQSAREEVGVKYLLEHLQKETSRLSAQKATPKPLNIQTKKKPIPKPILRDPSLSSSSLASVDKISLQDKSMESMDTSVNSE
ncbi:unnamed protein product [Ceutorhynchus assimilis]|uniref:Uncharacterized protein n=1 Tax=Ceutorhynchus assimilis TaxID=467358 RepID=A0A9P0DC94_9CUCU|nr:unnamed protein product [Ceutorhynchus assimilis]